MSLHYIVDIDLSTGTWTRSAFPEHWFRKCLLGRGFNVEFLYENIPAGLDPLTPRNILVISCGLLTGTAAPASSRIHINALSPQTGLLGSSNVGGQFGAGLRSSGIMSLILRDRAPHPVYILIEGDSLEILDARKEWGLDTWETRDRIRDNVGQKNLSLLSIGPAGERLTRFACIMTDSDHAAGRTGMGAVMGSKNLKAIAVRKAWPGPKADSPAQRKAIKNYIKQIRQSPEFIYLSEHGGAGYVKWADEMGILAARNYRENHFDAADRIDGRTLLKSKIRSKGCRHCPVQCKAELFFKEGRYKGMKGVRPEFESMAVLGSKCGLKSPEAIVYLDNLCSRLGLDTISAGGAIAFAMDLFERGILTKQDTDGLDLTWGNPKAMEVLIKQMAFREGPGAVLSEGILKASETIGRGSERFAPQVKSLELSAFHPSHIMGTALAYAVSTRGGDFNNFFPSLEYVWSRDKAARELGTPEAVELSSVQGKGALVKRSVLVNIALDCLGLCKVPALSLIGAFDLENEAALASALTGWDIDENLLFKAAERIANLERLFNLRQGATANDDRLPRMFFEPENSRGGSLESPDRLGYMVQDFYRAMGWHENGLPTEKTLKRLDLPQK